MQWPGWDRLPLLPRAALSLPDLEEQWKSVASVTGLVEPRGVRGDFFSEHVGEVVKELQDGGTAWRQRLKRFADETADWRRGLRGKDVAVQTSAELGRTIAALRAWEAVATPEDLDSVEGRWSRAYLATARGERQEHGRGSKRVEFFRAAASYIDPTRPPPVPRDDPLYSAMQRRSLILEAKAVRIEAFLKMRTRPQRWTEVADGFSWAAELAERAQGIQEYPKDRSAELNRMWEALALMRAAQSSLDLDTARLQLVRAKELSTEVEDPFRFGGRWSSTLELGAERHVIDCLEELAKGQVAQALIVSEHLKRWLTNTAKSRRPPYRTRTLIMSLRHNAAEMAQLVQKGDNISLPLSALRRSVASDPYVKECFADVIGALDRADRSGAAAYPKVIAALLGNIREVDGDGRSLPPADSTPRLTPSWAANAEGGTEVTAAAALLRYFRLVAEYLYNVYRDAAAEEGIEVPDVAGSQFQRMPLAAAGEVFSGLQRALAWSDGRYPQMALERLASFAGIASDSLSAGSQSAAQDLLAAVLDKTLVDLFPLVVEGVADNPPDSFPATIEVVRCDRERRSEYVSGVATRPPSWPRFALKPRYKQRDRLEQVISQRHAKTIHLYSADSWPRPARVEVWVEGPSDRSALEAYLDVRLPWWRGYDVEVIGRGGDELPARFRESQLRQVDGIFAVSNVIIMADGDKRSNRDWEKKGVWRHQHSFVVTPDLEMLHPTALADTLAQQFDCEIDDTDLIRMDRDYRAGKAARTVTQKNFAEYLQDELALGGSIKNEATASVLGGRLARYGIPVLDRVAARIDQIANGFDHTPAEDFPYAVVET